MRLVIITLALLLGLAPAHAKDAVLVKLRDNAAPRAHVAAKPAPAKKTTPRAKKKPPTRAKTVAKSKHKAKPKATAKKHASHETSDEPRLRPMP